MTCYEVLKIVSEKDRDCLENVKNILNDALDGSKYFKVKEIKFLSDSIKIEFENELSYEERDSEDGRMLFESKYIMNAISNIKKQILEQVEIK